MRKKNYITLVNLFLGFLIFNLMPSGAMGAPCPHLSCEDVNPVGCECGTDVTDAVDRWCCAVDNWVLSTKDACQSTLGCRPVVPCEYQSCEAPNNEDCLCDTLVADNDNNPWCCAAAPAVADNQVECQAQPGCESSNGNGNGGNGGNGNGGGGGSTTIENPLNTDTFEELIDAIARFIFWIGMALAPVMLVISGFLFVTSGGSPDRVTTAKKLALYTMIGLVIILLASGLIKVIQSILGVT